MEKTLEPAIEITTTLETEEKAMVEEEEGKASAAKMEDHGT